MGSECIYADILWLGAESGDSERVQVQVESVRVKYCPPSKHGTDATMPRVVDGDAQTHREVKPSTYGYVRRDTQDTGYMRDYDILLFSL